MSATETYTMLVHTTTEEHEYDRDEVLAVYHALAPFLVDRSGGHAGYADEDWRTDDDRIVTLFELTKESLFGDMIFGGVNWDHGSDLITKDENGDPVSNQESRPDDE